MYFNGLGVKQDYLKAIEYYEFSSKQNNSYAHFILAVLYSTGYILDINVRKAIQYSMKSIKEERGVKCRYNEVLNKYFYYFECNNYRYISYNNLGLIYHTVLDDTEKAEFYIKESAFAEYPFGQNNFGLLNQFYLNNIAKAEYMFGRSSEHKFALAEYNLGYLFEKDGKITESIQYYIRASDHVDEPLIYRNINFFDRRLEISKMFIICFTNLKLTEYYFSLSEYEESKKYFIKSIKFCHKFKDHPNYKFKFHFPKQTHEEYSNNLFSYIKIFILDFPLFNLINQPNLRINSIINYLISNVKYDSNEEEKVNDQLNLSFKISKEIEKEIEIRNDENDSKNNNHSKKKIVIFNENNNNSLLNYLEKQKNIKQIDKHENLIKEKEEEKENKLEKYKYKEIKNKFLKEKENRNPESKYEYEKELNNKKIKNNLNGIIFDDPGKLFDFVIKSSNLTSNSKLKSNQEPKTETEKNSTLKSESKSEKETEPDSTLKSIFIEEIRSIIYIMNEILYTPPYSILFGRISIEIPKPKPKQEPDNRKDIDKNFYSGFGIQ